MCYEVNKTMPLCKVFNFTGKFYFDENNKKHSKNITKVRHSKSLKFQQTKG